MPLLDPSPKGDGEKATHAAKLLVCTKTIQADFVFSSASFQSRNQKLHPNPPFTRIKMQFNCNMCSFPALQFFFVAVQFSCTAAFFVAVFLFLVTAILAPTSSASPL
jgi:hypothetical protein